MLVGKSFHSEYYKFYTIGKRLSLSTLFFTITLPLTVLLYTFKHLLIILRISKIHKIRQFLQPQQ